ncbi:MAG: hypothetical protein ACI84C_001150 [Flavobacteriales bacterium]|jgi:hypothetical protein
MKKISLIVATIAIAFSANAQNLNASNGGYETTRNIDGKKFRVMYYEYEIDKTSDTVWDEISGNFVNVGEVHKSIEASSCESGDVTEGLGASRYCKINFDGKNIEIKERITEYIETETRKELTYDIYESKNFPAKVYNTWVVRTGSDGKTYLGNTFIYRAKPAMMTKMMGKKLTKLGALRNSVLTFKHYLETGEKKPDPAIFDELYPEV